MRKIKKIVVHTSDSPDDRDVRAADIDQWHRERGWSMIGYHAVVTKDGDVEEGRPEERSGAHVKGHNKDSLGIVWVGRDDCNEAQQDALVAKILEWMEDYGLEVDDVYGHYEFDSGKTCPNIDMDEFREILNETQQDNSLSGGTKEHLPDGPSEDEIDVTLEDIENQILEDE